MEYIEINTEIKLLSKILTFIVPYCPTVQYISTVKKNKFVAELSISVLPDLQGEIMS